MWIKQLRLTHFRNYHQAGLELNPNIHVIRGGNGQGKTSLLEAIHYLCLSGSFKTSADSHAVRYGSAGFCVEGSFVHDEQGSVTPMESMVRITYQHDGGKTIFADNKKVDRISQLFGLYPAVVSSPDDVRIVDGSPHERRRFLDQTLSQISATYLKDLQDYRQALRQRNALLQAEPIRPDLLDTWDLTLATVGSRIVKQRLDFIAEFEKMVGEVYQSLVPDGEAVKVRYWTSVFSDDEESPGASKFTVDDIAREIKMHLTRNRSKDILRQNTGIGPHKDDLHFLLNGHPFREMGSQGQMKTFAIALKMAGHMFLFERHDQKPILLLDDVLSELDNRRRSRLFGYLENVHQVFITSAEPQSDWPVNREIRFWTVDQNRVRAEA